MIGIYDSGIGGLGIFNAIKAVLPEESITYFGDTAYFPFGQRSTAEIKQITLASLKKLAEHCNIVVIACNTASVSDLDYYRTNINIPIIGVVPVIKTASQLTQNNVIALLATPATVQAPYTDELIKKFAPNKQIIKIGCNDLAEQIEFGKTPVLSNDIKQINNADVVVLGCTHYTLIKGLIQKVVGANVKVIDSNEAVARQVLRVMTKLNLFQPAKNPQYLFSCSGNKEKFLGQVKKYIKVIF
ncbi:MAG: glutamate racemase [Patescibacteria group bacterium]|jgi:glutamate racemase